MQWKLRSWRTFCFCSGTTVASCCLYRKRTAPKLVFLDSNNLTTSNLRTRITWTSGNFLRSNLKTINPESSWCVRLIGNLNEPLVLQFWIKSTSCFSLAADQMQVGLVCGRYFSDWRFIRHTILDMLEAIFFPPRQGAGRSKTGCRDTHSRLLNHRNVNG